MDKITHKVRCEQWTSIIKECLAVECLKRPGVENMAFRTNPFFTGNEFSEKKHTLLH